MNRSAGAASQPDGLLPPHSITVVKRPALLGVYDAVTASAAKLTQATSLRCRTPAISARCSRFRLISDPRLAAGFDCSEGSIASRTLWNISPRRESDGHAGSASRVVRGMILPRSTTSVPSGARLIWKFSRGRGAGP
jgi:hypothetical protein